jgi:hypothetical protein
MRFIFILLAFSSALISLAQAPVSDLSVNELTVSPQLQPKVLQLQNTDLTRVINTTETAEIVLQPQATTIIADPFLSASFAWDEVDNKAGNSIVSIRFASDLNNWQAWQQLKPDAHAEQTKKTVSSELLFLDNTIKFYQLKIQTNLDKKGHLLKNLLINFFSPGRNNTPLPIINPNNGISLRQNACPCPQPAFVTRVGWNCPQGPTTPSTTTVTHLIVHHSAGANTASDWRAVVLSIWNFHVNTNGWADIGYNWLIDPNGDIYEGRGGGNNVVGAHFCATNGNTMGTCMIGTYNSTNISTAARNKLTDILAWKICNSNLNPTSITSHAGSGLNLNTISGHRDGCATDCPGNQLYPTLPAIRTETNDKVAACNLTTAVPQVTDLQDFKIIPNPAGATTNIQMMLKVSNTKQLQYRIINASGQVITTSSTQRINGTAIIPLTGLVGKASGLYSLQVWLDKENFAVPVVIK